MFTCCGDCQPNFPLTKELDYYFFLLKISSCFLVIIAISKIFIYDYSGIFSDLIVLIIVMILLLCVDYYISGLLIFMLIFNAFHSLVFIGLKVQNIVIGTPNKFTGKDKLLIGAFCIESISLIFDILLIVLTFYIYREIKYCQFKASGEYRINNF